MKEFTRFLKNEATKDISEQNAQSLNDKADFYRNKWTDLISKAETVAQKNICWDVLERIKRVNMDKYKGIIVKYKDCRCCLNAIDKDKEVVKCMLNNGWCIPIIEKE